jgi:hypothetical protein
LFPSSSPDSSVGCLPQEWIFSEGGVSDSLGQKTWKMEWIWEAWSFFSQKLSWKTVRATFVCMSDYLWFSILKFGGNKLIFSEDCVIFQWN